MLQVDAALLTDDLEGIDESADSPWPCGIAADLELVRIKTVERFLASLLRMGHHLPERESYHGDVPVLEYLLRKTSGTHSDAYDCRERTISFRILDQRTDGKGLAVDGNIRNEGIPFHSCIDTLTRSLRLESNFIMLKLGKDLSAPTFPLGILLYTAAVLEFERVWKCLQDLKFFKRRHGRSLKLRSRIFFVKYKRDVAAGGRNAGSKNDGRCQFQSFHVVSFLQLQ